MLLHIVKILLLCHEIISVDLFKSLIQDSIVLLIEPGGCQRRWWYTCTVILSSVQLANKLLHVFREKYIGGYSAQVMTYAIPWFN